MLIFPKHDLLLITPPKTAGRSVRRFVCNQPKLDAHEVVGPVVGGRVSSHTAKVPDDYATMRRAVVVRHPLDRLVSLWHHKTQWWAYQGGPSPGFEEFVVGMTTRKYATSVFGITIDELLGDTHIDEIVYLEHLETDLRRIGIDFAGRIPKSDGSVRREWSSYFSRSTEEMARSWASRDFERFGYVGNGVDRDPVQAVYLEPSNGYLKHRRDLLAKLPKGGVAAEVGVFSGDFSLEILEVAEPERLHLIDQWNDSHRMVLNRKTLDGRQALRQVRTRLRDPIEDGQVVLQRGDSLSKLAEAPDGYFDWIYLDTSHFYYDTFAELCLCAQKLKPDGYLCGHDYCESFEHGVVRAVELFCRQFGYEMIYRTDEEKVPAFHRHGLNATVPEKIAYNSFALQKT